MQIAEDFGYDGSGVNETSECVDVEPESYSSLSLDMSRQSWRRSSTRRLLMSEILQSSSDVTESDVQSEVNRLYSKHIREHEFSNKWTKG